MDNRIIGMSPEEVMNIRGRIYGLLTDMIHPELSMHRRMIDTAVGVDSCISGSVASAVAKVVDDALAAYDVTFAEFERLLALLDKAKNDSIGVQNKFEETILELSTQTQTVEDFYETGYANDGFSGDPFANSQKPSDSWDTRTQNWTPK